ncbi:putative transposase [Xylaria curta]|nr:putative transposase [Xylaria curta]
MCVLITYMSTTIEEVTSQSVCIKNRIFDHQSSSPTSIIESSSIRERERENGQLRDNNYIPSKRRKTKNKQLQSGGSLMIAECNAPWVEGGGDSEVVGKEGESNRPRKRARGGPRLCGHNARTCSIDVDCNGEENSD